MFEGENWSAKGIYNFRLQQSAAGLFISKEGQSEIKPSLTTLLIKCVFPVFIIYSWLVYKRETDSRHLFILEGYRIRENSTNSAANFRSGHPIEEGCFIQREPIALYNKPKCSASSSENEDQKQTGASDISQSLYLCQQINPKEICSNNGLTHI